MPTLAVCCNTAHHTERNFCICIQRLQGGLQRSLPVLFLWTSTFDIKDGVDENI